MPPKDDLDNLPSYTAQQISDAHKVLYNEGLKMRVKVAGKEYVEKSLKASEEGGGFGVVMQEYVAESCWGTPWTRPLLPLKLRSFLNIALLCNQNRSTELATHVRGALNNGASAEEVAEVILHTAAYCGMPAGIEGFRVAGKVVETWREENPGVLEERKKAVESKGKKREEEGYNVVGREEDLGADVRMNVDDI